MSVLRLYQEPLEEPITSGQGKYADPCKTCPLSDVCVTGCCGSHGTCEQKSCHMECNDCGGGPILRYEGGNVPAVCSKAPLREAQLLQVRKDHFSFKRRKPIKLKTDSIVITQGSPGRVEGSPYPDDCEAIAVNLRHVWSSRGWFSSDMKDYMRVPKETKLILLTSTHDDVLERAWEHEVQHDDIGEMGFDYWQAVTFSQYGTMSRFNNLWLGYRTLNAIEDSGASFCTTMPVGIDLENKKATGPWRKCAKAIPQLMVNWQFTSIKDPVSFRWMVAKLKRNLAAMPAVKSLWFVGVVSADEIYNLKLQFPMADCYFLSVNPWLAAFKGDEFSKRGKLRKSTIPRRELVLRNQHNYANLVKRAVQAAATESAVANSL